MKTKMTKKEQKIHDQLHEAMRWPGSHRLCGCLEKCFERGDNEWGHWGSVMCKYMSEVEYVGSIHVHCEKVNGEIVRPYFNQCEYDILKQLRIYKENDICEEAQDIV